MREYVLRHVIAATALCGTLAAPAMAQTAGTTSAQQEPSAGADAVSASDIVVTGLKRDERLIDVPVSAQVFGEKALAQAGVNRPTDFLELTPNVSFYTSINRSDFFVNVRGQTSIRGAEPSVRIIIDGVPVANPAEFTSELVDVQQIEVLRGPQGAFYGRNASAGAIVVTTKAPTDDWSGQINAGYGNWDTYRANASIGGAIIPGVLRVRGTIAASHTDGPFTNINTGVKEARYKEILGRLRVDWQAADNLTFDARVNLQHAKGGSYSYLPQIAVHPLSPNGTTVGGVRITSVDTNNVNIPYVADVKGLLDQDIFTTSLKADWDLGFATFTSVTSYADLQLVTGGKNLPYGNRSDPTTNFAGWAAIYGDQSQNNNDQYHQFDQEIRLTSSDDGPFKWQIGFEYLWNKYRRYRNVALTGMIPVGQTLLGYNGYTAGVPSLNGPALLPPDPRILYGPETPYASRTYTINDRTGKNYAPFANVQFDITEQLELGLAGRYDIEKRHTGSIGTAAISPFSGTSFNQCVRALGWTLDQCIAGRDRTFKQFQPKVTLTYKIPEFGSIFASWGKGFKTGGFNDIGTRELLIRARLPVYLAVPGTTAAQARAQAEAAVFSQDFYDKEVSTNYELGFKAQLLDRRVNISGAVFLTDVRNSQQYRFDPAAALASIDSIDKSRIKGFEFDVNARVTDSLTLFGGYGYVDSTIRKFLANPALEGNRTPYSAKTNLTLGAQVNHPITDTYNLTARGEFNRTGSAWFDIQNTPGTKRDPYNIVNARLGVASDTIEISAYGRNLFNKKYATEAVVLFPYLDVVARGMTRSYGLEAKYRF